MTLIINPRGTNGSGKTTLALSLIDTGAADRIDLMPYVRKTGRPGKIVAYQQEFGLGGRALRAILIGRYDTNCGGCDGIPTQDLICEAVRTALRLAPDLIVYEGLLISGLYGRYHALDREVSAQGHRHVWAFLDTPLDVCIERTRARTAKPANWDPSNVRSKHRAVEGCARKARAAGLLVISVPSAASRAPRAEILALAEAARVGT